MTGNRMHESSSRYTPPAAGPFVYGRNVVGPLPPGAERSELQEWQVMRSRAPAGVALIAGAFAIAGIGALLWMTRPR